jgi:hypothetical protein
MAENPGMTVFDDEYVETLEGRKDHDWIFATTVGQFKDTVKLKGGGKKR